MTDKKEIQSIIERVVGEVSERRIADLRKDVVKRVSRETEDIVDATFSTVTESHLPDLKKEVSHAVTEKAASGIEHTVEQALDGRVKDLKKELIDRVSDEARIISHGVIGESLDKVTEQLRKEIVEKVGHEAQGGIERALTNTVDKRSEELRKELIERVVQETRKMVEHVLPELLSQQISQLKGDLSGRVAQESQATIEKIVPDILERRINEAREDIVTRVNQKTQKTIESLVHELVDKNIGEARKEAITSITNNTRKTLEETIPDVVEKRVDQLRQDVVDGVRQKTRESVGPLMEEVFGDRVEELQKDAAAKVMKEIEPAIAAGLSAKSHTAEPQHAATGSASGLLDATVASIQEASSQTEILRALLEGAAQFCGRVALFVSKGGSLMGWQGRGFAQTDQLKGFTLSATARLVDRALSDKTAVTGSASDFDPAFFGAMGQVNGNVNLMPLLVRDKVPALLYADGGEKGSADVAALQLLARAAGFWLEIQALRRSTAAASEPSEVVTTPLPGTLQAPSTPAPAVEAPAPAPAEAGFSAADEEILKKAKRFAKLLVDEIKLYNKEKVAEGKANKDIYDRLKEDIDKSRATYEKRYGSTVASSQNFFNDEVIRSLADNEASLMGSNFQR